MRKQSELFMEWYKENLSKRFSYSCQNINRISKKLIDILIYEPVNVKDIEDYFIENLTSERLTKLTYNKDEELCDLIGIEIKKFIGSLAKKGSIKLSQIYDLYFGQYGGCCGEHDEAYIGPIPLRLNSLGSCLKLRDICGYIIKDLRRLFPYSLGFWYKTNEELENKNYIDVKKGNLDEFAHSFLHLPEIVTINAAHLNPQSFFKYIKELEMREKKKMSKPAISPEYFRILFGQTENICRAVSDSYEKLEFVIKSQ